MARFNFCEPCEPTSEHPWCTHVYTRIIRMEGNHQRAIRCFRSPKIPHMSSGSKDLGPFLQPKSECLSRTSMFDDEHLETYWNGSKPNKINIGRKKIYINPSYFFVLTRVSWAISIWHHMALVAIFQDLKTSTSPWSIVDSSWNH